jgi:starch synthase
LSSLFNVLFAVAEASPLIKVGGLGDVAGSLPRALRQLGHDVRIIMPRYGLINLGGYELTLQSSFNLPFMGGQEDIGISQLLLEGGTPVYLVENERYFSRPAVYGETDDLERFLLFSLVVIEASKKLGWQPDIFHCHDWHTGIVPALLRVARINDQFYSTCASIFTIHNLGYQGWFNNWFADHASLYDYFPPIGNPLRDKVYSMTAIGIYNSDIISTVSETYAREIMTPEYGMGLETMLQYRKNSLFGILNGIDYEEFNPTTDHEIAANYDPHRLEMRITNKLALQEKAGLPVNAEIPLFGLAARLVDQKGIDILVGALNSLFGEANAQFVLQGTGEPRYEESLRNLQSNYPDKAQMFLTLDFSLARQIFAGCDIYLSPSRYEPCGLSHLIAMHYGAIPVVRHTGGLAETVIDCSSDLSSGLGFVFEGYDQNELLTILRRVVTAFHRKEGWQNLTRRVMQADFSWKSSISKYVTLYEMAQRKAKDDNTNH